MIGNFLIRLVLNALALLAVAKLVPGFHVGTIYNALFAALLIGLINTFIKPVITLLTLPITIFTLGLFYFVINIGLFWFASKIVNGFTIDTIQAAIVGWLVYSVFGIFISKVVKGRSTNL